MERLVAAGAVDTLATFASGAPPGSYRSQDALQTLVLLVKQTASDCAAARQQLLPHMPPLVRLMRSVGTGTATYAACVLALLCLHSNPQQLASLMYVAMRAGCILAALVLLASGNDDSEWHAAIVLRHSAFLKQHAEAVIAGDGLNVLLRCVQRGARLDRDVTLRLAHAGRCRARHSAAARAMIAAAGGVQAVTALFPLHPDTEDVMIGLTDLQGFKICEACVDAAAMMAVRTRCDPEVASAGIARVCFGRPARGSGATQREPFRVADCGRFRPPFGKEPLSCCKQPGAP